MTDSHLSKDKLLIEMKGVVKIFPGVKALDGVDFQLRPGEIHMLLGENGAGKSTLIKVLSGAYKADQGEIFICGKPINIELHSPRLAIEKGLRFIYQEVNLVGELDIARNMFLGLEPYKFKWLGIIDKKTLYNSAERYLKMFHMDLDPVEIVGNLSVTKQKMVEIARALVTDSKVLVLDEPTDVLEDRSRNDLFDVIKKLKTEQNIGFIYISHRYAEVHDLGDRVTILRDGANIGTYDIRDVTLNEMIEKMIGGKLEKQYPTLPEPKSEEILRLENIKQGEILNDISLSVKKGEILGITGLVGSGKTELARAIAGVRRIDEGRIFLENKRVYNKSPGEAIKNGIAYLTEDRKREGLILDHSFRNNYALPSLERLNICGFIQHKLMSTESNDFLKKLNIKAGNIYTLAGQLSGGNQQKAVLAKWLGTKCKLILFDEPTRGVDIKGRSDVYRIMKQLLEQGIGILLFSSDYQEVLEMSHRIIVLRNGSIKKEFKRGEATEEKLLQVAVAAV